MGSTFILVLCLAIVFCLAPLAVYLLWLALMTRRERPTVVSGQWDFVGLATGLSGFVFFGGGLVLSLFQSNFRYWMRGNFESLRSAWGQEKLTWILLSLFYLALAITWVVASLSRRRRSLVVYNIVPGTFDGILGEVFEQLNRTVERRGNVWSNGMPLCEVDRFEAGQTVTLRWLSDDRLFFQDVDRLIREAVRSTSSEDNPATRWLMAAAVSTGMAAICCMGLLLYAFSLLH